MCARCSEPIKWFEAMDGGVTLLPLTNDAIDARSRSDAAVSAVPLLLYCCGGVAHSDSLT
jgi:hypothetical protein